MTKSTLSGHSWDGVGHARPALRACGGMPYQGSPGGRGREEASGRSLAYHGTALAGGSALHGNPGPSSPEVSAQSSTVSNLIRCPGPCLRRRCEPARTATAGLLRSGPTH